MWLDRAGGDRPVACALLLFALAFTVRIALILLLHFDREPLLAEPNLVVKSLVREGLFGNPFPVPTGPTAHLAPGLPFVLSILSSCFGEAATPKAAKALSAAACSVQYALLPMLAAVGGLRRAVGILAGGVGALVPVFLWTETNGSWESSYIAAMLVALLILSARLWGGVRVSPFVYGAAWGFAFLFAPALLLVFAALLGIWWRRSRNTRAVLTAAAIAFFVVLPWIVRNYIQLGSVFWLRDNFGLELHISNNPIARPLLADNLASYRDHPYDNAEEALRLKQIGEVAYYQRRGALAEQWIRSNPKRFAELVAARIWYFWFPWLKRPAATLLAAAVSLGGLLGLALAVRRKLRPAASLFGLVWLVYPLPYYFIQVDPRYRYPVYSEALLLTAFFVVSCFERLEERQRTAAG